MRSSTFSDRLGVSSTGGVCATTVLGVPGRRFSLVVMLERGQGAKDANGQKQGTQNTVKVPLIVYQDVDDFPSASRRRSAPFAGFRFFLLR